MIKFINYHVHRKNLYDNSLSAKKNFVTELYLRLHKLHLDNMSVLYRHKS